MHKPIQLKDISLSYPHKTCFENFSSSIECYSRIGVIGRNGSGKSTLLKLLHGSFANHDGEVVLPDNMSISYVAQVINEFDSLSGGQRFNKALTEALSTYPDVLLLDEPTNHLDLSNRKSLMRMLNSYHGTLVVVTHDLELLRNNVDKIWHIENGLITEFSGVYDDYIAELRKQRTSIEQEMLQLDKKSKGMHEALMQEQKRASKSKAKGEKNIENRKWPTIVSQAKARRAEETAGKNKKAISNKKQELQEKLAHLRLPEAIVPKFSLDAGMVGSQTIVSVTNGSVGYKETAILKGISFSLASLEHIAIQGDNASGKSTFIKALLSEEGVNKGGEWFVPNRKDVGYLDQHYSNLSAEDTVLESIENLRPDWSHAEIRKHLNDFLFRKNEEVNANVASLSGGEKVRLSLAQIAAKPSKLLILDEVTNNLDLETKEHVIQVLRQYPGAMIVISHEQEFLNRLNIATFYTADSGVLS